MRLRRRAPHKNVNENQEQLLLASWQTLGILFMESDPLRHGPNRWSERCFELKSDKPKVLVVDDYETGAHALADYLLLEDMECRVAHEGAEALAISLVWSPHIILMDISMPILDGIAAARALRQNELTKHIVIVAFTALPAPELQRHLLGHEFDGYCQKGQPPDALVTFILSARLLR